MLQEILNIMSPVIIEEKEIFNWFDCFVQLLYLKYNNILKVLKYWRWIFHAFAWFVNNLKDFDYLKNDTQFFVNFDVWEINIITLI